MAVCAMVCWCVAARADAQTRRMTLTDVLARAREQAPQILSARLALQETRGRLVGASLRQQSNPELDARLGNRNGSSGRFTDVQLNLAQALEPGGRRSARIAAASAAIDQGTATVDDTVRLVMQLAASSYYRVLHAEARIQLLTTAENLAANALSVAERRFRAGDIAVLDVNIARASLARIRSEREAARALRAVAAGGLKQLLRVEEDVELDGALARPDDVDLTGLLEASTQRPELRALESAIREAESDVQLGHTLNRPSYAVGVQYGREEGDQIVLGGLTVTLPVFANGQELRAVGSARATRLRAELAAARTRIQIEVRTAHDAFTRRQAAIRVLETEAIPGLDENQALATRSFDVGQLGLPELLIIRRELLETRAEYLEALLEAALARVELDASAGRLP